MFEKTTLTRGIKKTQTLIEPGHKPTAPPRYTVKTSVPVSGYRLLSEALSPINTTGVAHHTNHGSAPFLCSKAQVIELVKLYDPYPKT